MPNRKNTRISLEGVTDIKTRDSLRQIVDKLAYLENLLKQTNVVYSDPCLDFNATTSWGNPPELKVKLPCDGNHMVQVGLMMPTFTPTDFFPLQAISVGQNLSLLAFRFVRNTDAQMSVDFVNGAAAPSAFPASCVWGIDRPPKGEHHYRCDVRYSGSLITPTVSGLVLYALEVK